MDRGYFLKNNWQLLFFDNTSSTEYTKNVKISMNRIDLDATLIITL